MIRKDLLHTAFTAVLAALKWAIIESQIQYRNSSEVVNQTVQTIAKRKAVSSDILDARCNHSSANIATAIESKAVDAGDRSGDGQRCQGYTTVESVRSNGHDGGGDSDGRECEAVSKSGIADGRQRGRKEDTHQRGGLHEHGVSHCGHRTGNGDHLQGGAVEECCSFDD